MSRLDRDTRTTPKTSFPRGLTGIAAAALVAGTLGVLPTVALAEPGTEAPGAGKAITEESAAGAQKPLTATETVKTDSQDGFATKQEAQDYLEKAKSEWAEKDKADAAATYEVTTTGPTASTTTTWSEPETSEVTAEEPFSSEDEANKWVEDEKAKYVDDDSTRYEVMPTITSSTETVNDGDPVLEKEQTTTSDMYETEESAREALNEAKEADPPTDLHKVDFSEVQEKTVQDGTEWDQTDVRYFWDKFKRDESRDAELERIRSEYGTYGEVKVENYDFPGGTVANGYRKVTPEAHTTYADIPEGSYVVVLKGNDASIWTLDSVDEGSKKSIVDVVRKGDPKASHLTVGDVNWCTGFGTSIQTQNGVCSVTQGDDGGYRLTGTHENVFSHVGWGALEKSTGSYGYRLRYHVPKMRTRYFFTKTVQDFVQSTIDVTTWHASYKVGKSTKVETTTWGAGYTVKKTTTYAVPGEQTKKPATPTVKKAEASPASRAVTMAPVAKAIPKTGDTVAAPMAVGLAFASAGAVLAGMLLRRRRD